MTSTASQESAMRLILPLPGNETFAQRLANAGGWELGVLEVRRFPDGESYVRLLSDVVGKSVYLVCTLARPDEGFLRLVFAADAARSLGARTVSLIAPYLSYMRQDRRFRAGEAVTSRSFARLISSSFDRLVTVDPHLHRYPALSSLYAIPTNTLHAAPLLADWIAEEVRSPLVIGPDEESEQWVSAIAERARAPWTVLRKVRHGDRSVDVARAGQHSRGAVGVRPHEAVVGEQGREQRRLQAAEQLRKNAPGECRIPAHAA